jgi:hypothetical protein
LQRPPIFCRFAGLIFIRPIVAGKAIRPFRSDHPILNPESPMPTLE